MAPVALVLGLGVTLPAVAAPSGHDPSGALLGSDGGLFGSRGVLGEDGGLLPALLGGHSDADELLGGAQDLAGGMGDLLEGIVSGDSDPVGGDDFGQGNNISIGPLNGIGLLGGLLGRF